MSRVFRTQAVRRPFIAVQPPQANSVPAPEPGPVVELPDPAEVLAAAKEAAEALVAAAQEEAARIIEDARAEAERLAVEAREAGRNDGYFDGHEKGLAEAESLVAEATKALDAARGAYTQMLADAEPKLLALVLEVSRKVLTDAFSADTNLVLDLIRKGLDALRDEREFTLRVPPALVTLLEGQTSALCREYGAKSMDVVGDPEVSYGAVILTPHGYVDVTIESQIRSLSTALAEARKKAMGMEAQ